MLLDKNVLGERLFAFTKILIQSSRTNNSIFNDQSHDLHYSVCMGSEGKGGERKLQKGEFWKDID